MDDDQARHIAHSIRHGLGVIALLTILAGCQAAASSDAVPASPQTGPVVPTACVGLGSVDCERIARAILVERAGQATYLKVGPFGCPDGTAVCPTTLTARPEGDATLDLAGGTQQDIHVRVRPDGSFDVAEQPGSGVEVKPASGPAGPGPVAFSLGHCGVSSGFDIDGSYWDPVGQVDEQAIETSEGTITFADRQHATFVPKVGPAIQLLRHEGPKFLPGCM